MGRGEHAAIRELRRDRKLVGLAVLAMLAALLAFPGVAAASHTPAPASVTVVGSLQSELGCPGDWQPECAATYLTYDGTDGVWQGTFTVPAGEWEYKVALNDSWFESYGAGGVNIPLSVGAPTAVKFVYDHETHLVTHTADPRSVVVVGDLQTELGCPGDWQADCGDTGLTYETADDVWQGTFTVPAGGWEYKVALNGSFLVNYGENATQDGANIGLSLGGPTDVKFYYDEETHWVTDNANSVIATAIGDFQSELGCPGDWQPECLRSWLQDPEGDGIYEFSTTAILAGSYEFKVALDEAWNTLYPASNVPFTVTGACNVVSFTYDLYDNSVDITTSPCNIPPVASDDAYTTDEDTTLTVAAPGVLGNDTDVDGDPLQGAGWTWYEPFGGTASVYLDGSFQFVPDLNFCGESVWTYQATDGEAESNWATVTITVNCVNDPPVADANGPYMGTIGVPVTFDGTGSSDPENAVLTFDWDFGDGSPEETDAGATPTHIYATAATYTVTLTVADDGELTDTAITSATITLGSESFDAVEATIEGLGLESAGFENSLLKKIQNAQKSFDKADGEVCEKLASFIAAVNAQDGKKLTPEQADLLRSQAEAIGDAYGCDT